MGRREKKEKEAIEIKKSDEEENVSKEDQEINMLEENQISQEEKETDEKEDSCKETVIDNPLMEKKTKENNEKEATGASKGNPICIVSEYFGEGEANSARRPIDRCRDMIERRSRSQSLKRKLAEKKNANKGPIPKKANNL